MSVSNDSSLISRGATFYWRSAQQAAEKFSAKCLKGLGVKNEWVSTKTSSAA